MKLIPLSFATICVTLTVSSLVKAQYRHEILYDGSVLAGSALDSGAQFLLGNFYRPARPAVNLFTPNTLQLPAETAGQIENYRKELEEEARVAAANVENGDNRFTTGGLQEGARSYVSVKVGNGDQKYDYRYAF